MELSCCGSDPEAFGTSAVAVNLYTAYSTVLCTFEGPKRRSRELFGRERVLILTDTKSICHYSWVIIGPMIMENARTS